MKSKEVFIKRPVNKASMNRRKPLQGVGINDADYTITTMINGTRITCPYYRVWYNMIQRCYSPSYSRKYPAYKDCSVHQDWYLFSTFRKWMCSQDWEGRALDKDLIVYGNKVYSHTTCVFILRSTNMTLIDKHTQGRTLLRGVYYSWNKFRVQTGDGGKSKYLGAYSTEIEAHNVWRVHKAGQLYDVANNEVDARVQEALRTRARELEVLLED